MFTQGHRLPNNKRKDNANLFPLYNGKSPGDEVGATMWLAFDKLSFRLQIIRSFTRLLIFSSRKLYCYYLWLPTLWGPNLLNIPKHARSTNRTIVIITTTRANMVCGSSIPRSSKKKQLKEVRVCFLLKVKLYRFRTKFFKKRKRLGTKALQRILILVRWKKMINPLK